MSQYQQPFFITEKVSNNAFNYERRQQTHEPKIYVPQLRQGTLADVKIGTQTAFEDFDETDTLRSYPGLETFIKTSIGNKPTYIFDNHNHAFFFWCLEYQQKTFRDGATLIHIDQHKDTRTPESFPSESAKNNLEEAFHYTNTILNVGNFIPAGQHLGFIKDLIIIDSEASMEALQPEQLPKGNLLLDIDLDFFCPDMDYISGKAKITLIKKLYPQANMVTICTSPYFIEQSSAIDWLHQIANAVEGES